MQYIIQTIRDIFSMGFDIILPVSGCILALAVSFVLFWIRFSSFRRNKKRYEKRLRQEGPAPVPAKQLPALVPPAADSAPFWGGNLVPELPLAGDALMLQVLSRGGAARAPLPAPQQAVRDRFDWELSIAVRAAGPASAGAERTVTRG